MGKNKVKALVGLSIGEGKENYTISNSQEFPKEGYVLNADKTICKNGGTITQDSTTKSINRSLDEKVGLITADEIVAAGSGKHGTSSSNYYLYKGAWYWSLSSYRYSNAHVFLVTSGGNLDAYTVHNAGGVAPVISLTSEYVNKMIGDGTIGNEYRVE